MTPSYVPQAFSALAERGVKSVPEFLVSENSGSVDGVGGMRTADSRRTVQALTQRINEISEKLLHAVLIAQISKNDYRDCSLFPYPSICVIVFIIGGIRDFRTFPEISQDFLDKHPPFSYNLAHP